MRDGPTDPDHRVDASPTWSIVELRQAWATLAMAGWPCNFRSVLGPLAAAALSLKRIQWSIDPETPLRFWDDLGSEIKVLDLGPRLVRRLLLDAWRRYSQTQAALTMRPPEGQTRPARVDA